ncbi:hypothetical protein SORBI_3001G096866 [Sorghum bicolor]|uniref:Uncharacterized protein n=1 Tax=Sorghum bicolor TaxID=4558 RepID=A0A1Z5S523_SORBI|nr:hypothetical protein SORBI_3001G096866 [Sorghum bicolor]
MQSCKDDFGQLLILILISGSFRRYRRCHIFFFFWGGGCHGVGQAAGAKMSALTRKLEVCASRVKYGDDTFELCCLRCNMAHISSNKI